MDLRRNQSLYINRIALKGAGVVEKTGRKAYPGWLKSKDELSVTGEGRTG